MTPPVSYSVATQQQTNASGTPPRYLPSGTMTPPATKRTANDQHRNQRSSDQYLPINVIQDQIYKAKAQAKTVTTMNGCLFIDYQYVGHLPPGYHV